MVFGGISKIKTEQTFFCEEDLGEKKKNYFRKLNNNRKSAFPCPKN